MIKDSVWLSFMKDRYGYIDPESLADGHVVDLHKALMWKYTGDEMDKKSDEVGVFRDSLKPKQGRKEWYFIICPILHREDSVDRSFRDDNGNWRDTIVKPSAWTEPPGEGPPKKKAPVEELEGTTTTAMTKMEALLLTRPCPSHQARPTTTTMTTMSRSLHATGTSSYYGSDNGDKYAESADEADGPAPSVLVEDAE